MCFGNSSTTSTTQSNSTATVKVPAWLQSAAKQNVGFAQNLQNTGFQPYTGEQVASFSPQQASSFGFATDIAGGVQPYVGETGALIDSYATAGPQRVSANPIWSQMSPYMNQYVAQALAPQLELQDQQFANQNKSFDSAATSAGAYGDTGWNLGRTNLTQQQDLARSGLIGNAYTAAFNTAIGAGAQDVANALGASTTNANLAETALGRQLTGATALNNIGTNAATLQNQFGGQQTAQSQAGLNAAYNQWLMGQQYPFQTIQALDQAIAAGRQGANITTNQSGTSTTTAPNNAGFGLIGSLAGSVLPYMFAADGGELPPGQPTVVGERGPEVFVPNTSGVVIPNEVLEAAREKRAKKLGLKFGIAA